MAETKTTSATEATEEQTAQPTTAPEAVVEPSELEKQIFVAVLAALAGRGIPAAEAATIAKEYTTQGAQLLS